ncbi:MAG: ABC transporter ATP-binding protein [Firmicutes bacterium]|nr:ABC transporter ATP-binding protein [Bacillota bacterium]
MLEVQGLTKVYTPKKGVPVRALDGVDLKFEETGMVFVLGKSGSGKSTLLNLIGGLDSVTEGDIVIKGKSSADFSQADFDSYRNTFIGFIFQEYNILTEFTVGKNIGLALELQGKKADKASIEEILAQVDLTGYAQRKPNELSGGQKQRVAIARALVKNPEIIMADEPTGALDSTTGKQVFETLQKLSKTKLVIIVSHDRDYAESFTATA